MSTRNEILDVAERYVRTRGFDAFSYADLARDIGIRKASIHHHFPTKAALAHDLIRDYAARILKVLAETRGTTADKLGAFIGIYRDAKTQGGTLCLSVAMSASKESFDAETQALIAGFHDDCRRWLARTYAENDGSITPWAAPDVAAAATLALVEGAQIMARAAGSIAVFDAATESLRSSLVPMEDPHAASE